MHTSHIHFGPAFQLLFWYHKAITIAVSSICCYCKIFLASPVAMIFKTIPKFVGKTTFTHTLLDFSLRPMEPKKFLYICLFISSINPLPRKSGSISLSDLFAITLLCGWKSITLGTIYPFKSFYNPNEEGTTGRTNGEMYVQGVSLMIRNLQQVFPKTPTFWSWWYTHQK